MITLCRLGLPACRPEFPDHKKGLVKGRLTIGQNEKSPGRSRGFPWVRTASERLRRNDLHVVGAFAVIVDIETLALRVGPDPQSDQDIDDLE